MEILGSLGIDAKLLGAQMINFGVLLWLLAKFLYKPIIERIEKDEMELKQAKIEKEELEQQKSAFAGQKRRELVEAKKRAREIIKEAEGIAQKVKRTARERENEEIAAMIRQARNNLESLRTDVEREILSSLQADISGSFRVSFLAALPISLQKEFQSVFWSGFIKRVKKLSLRKIEGQKLAEVINDFRIASERGDGEKDVPGVELEKVITQRLGPMILEYAYPLSEMQARELEELVSEKIGVKLSIAKKQNKELINGFRFEIAGIIIESNLLDIINNATNLTQ